MNKKRAGSTKIIVIINILIFQVIAACSTPTQVSSTSAPEDTTARNPSPHPTLTSIQDPEIIAVQSPLSLPKGEWVELTPMPSWVTEISGALLDGKFYIAGGLQLQNSVNVSSMAGQVYDVRTDTWVYTKRLPEPRNHVAMATSDGKIYMFGGGGMFPDIADQTKAWVYDPLTDDWNSIAPLPQPRFAAAAVTLGEHIYIVGGIIYGPEATDMEKQDAALRYNPASDEWDILAPTQETHEHTSAVVLNGKIYLIGGRFDGLINSVEIYDPENDTWAFGTPLNEGQAAHVAILLDGRIYVCGGEDIEGGRSLDIVQIYDPETDSWSYGPTMPYAIHGLAGFAYGDAIYLVGGSDLIAGLENHGRVLAFRP